MRKTSLVDYLFEGTFNRFQNLQSPRPHTHTGNCCGVLDFFHVVRLDRDNNVNMNSKNARCKIEEEKKRNHELDFSQNVAKTDEIAGKATRRPSDRT